MLSRRSILLGSAAILTAARPALAFEFQPYDPAAVQKAIKSGKPVVVHVYASWCLQCHMQANILSGMTGDKAYDRIAFYKVDYDGQKDVVSALACPRSTLIAYKGGKEVARMSWGVTQDDVVRVLNAAL